MRRGTAHIVPHTASQVNVLMIHYTCDRCKRLIDSSSEARYQVAMDVQCIGEPDGNFCRDDCPCDDVDSLTALNETLLMNEDRDLISETFLPVLRQYDLCPRCYRQFSSNPLGRELAIAIGFSNN